MTKNFWNPTNIASLVIVLIYLLPFTPYVDLSTEIGGKEQKISFSGLQMLINSATIKGEAEKQGDEVLNLIYKGELPGNEEKSEYGDYGRRRGGLGFNSFMPKLKPVFGYLDKLSFLMFAGALVLLFSGFKESNEEQGLPQNALRWTKIAMLTIGTLLMIRYMFIPIFVFPINVVWSVSLGAFLTQAALVVIYFESKLK
jgi:hypothetical protein